MSETERALCGFGHAHPSALLEVEIDGKRWAWPCAVAYLLQERERLQDRIGRMSINPDHSLAEGLIKVRMFDTQAAGRPEGK